MSDNTNRSLRVFLCHASSDKSQVQDLYLRLINDGIDAWLDKEKLIPGQNWQIEIPKAVRNSDVVLVCLSSQSINKEGFVQKEIKIALDTADEKPEGTIFIIPARLEECNLPERISHFHWVDLFSDNGYEWLLKALRLRASTIGLSFESTRKDYIPHENFKQEKEIPHTKSEENKNHDSKDTNTIKSLTKKISELENLRILLQKPVSIDGLVGGAFFYFVMFAAIIVGVSSIYFDTSNDGTVIVSLLIALLPTIWVISKIRNDRKVKNDESLERANKEIQDLKNKLQSLQRQQ